MSAGQSFGLHPAAAHDITEIWEFIAEDNPRAAGRVREDILAAIRGLVPFPKLGSRRPDLTKRNSGPSSHTARRARCILGTK